MYSRKLFISFYLLIIFSANLLAQDIATGVRLIRSEKYSEAKKYFVSLLGSKVNSEACFYLGEIYFQQENLDSAKLFYDKGIESNKKYPLNYAGLVRINIIQGNSAEVEKNQEEAIDLGNEKNPEVYVVLSKAYSKIKENKKAIELLNHGLKISTQHANTYLALGNIYLGENNGTDAVKNFQKAIDVEPSNPEALTSKAKVYILINNNEGAISLLDEAIKNDPSYAPAYLELAELYYNMKNYSKAAENYSLYLTHSEVTLEKNKRYISILYMNKDYQKVIDMLKEMEKTDPNNPSSIRILAYSYLRLEQNQNSMSYFQRLFEIPNVEYLSTDYENYANLLTKTGNDSLAVLYLTKVVDMDSTRKDILSSMSILYFKNRKWDGVITTLERKGTLTAQEYFDLGKAYYFVQNYTKADSVFNILTVKVPDLGIAAFWQARVKTNFDPESDQGLAKPFYEKFLSSTAADTSKNKKECIEAYSYLGYYFYIKDDKVNSKDNWLKVKALDPENPQAIAALKEFK